MKQIEICINLSFIIATDHITWTGDCKKAANTTFHKTTRRCDIIGAMLDYRNHLHVEWTTLIRHLRGFSEIQPNVSK